MGHVINWDNEDKTVVLQSYTDPVAKDDLYQLVKKFAEMLATCDHTVHLIVDERKVNFIMNSADLNYIQKMLQPNQGTVVAIVLPGNRAYKELFMDRVTQNLGNDQLYYAESVH